MDKLKRLSGNELKVLAVIAMTFDHVGTAIFEEAVFLRMIGRIAFPIFAYMLAEGCRYTKNRKKHLVILFTEGILMQAVFTVFEKSLYMNIFITLTFSVMIIYLSDYLKRKTNIIRTVIFAAAVISIFILTEIVPHILNNTDLYFDYGFAGILLPVVIYYTKEKKNQLLISAVGVIILSLTIGGIEWYSLLSLIPISLYNGKKGKMNMKYFFYIYYPVHLVIIYLLSILIR